MMKEELQPPHHLLFAPAKQGSEVMGTDETMAVDKPDNVAVAFCQQDGRSCGDALETR